MRKAIVFAALLLTPMEETQADEASMLKALDEFGQTYNRFAAEWSRGKFDVRLAKLLSERWRDVERCGNWPRNEEQK